MNEKTIALVEHRLSQAAETLKAAQQLLVSLFFRDAVNRAYYAMFYAANALLAARTLSASKHSGVVSLFGQHYVKPGNFPSECGRHLRQAFELRQESDYADFIEPTEAQAEEVINNAIRFLDEARRAWAIEKQTLSP